MRKPVGTLLLGAVGILVVAILSLSRSGVGAGAAGTVPTTKAVALQSVASFAGVAADSLAASDPIDGVLGSFYQVNGATVAATVDVADGRVTTLVLLGIVTDRTEIALTEADALDTARAFLDGHELSWQGFAESVALVNHGETNEYVVTWDRVERGVIVPASRGVGIDAASGRVFRYHDLRHAYTDPGQPKISEAAAIDAAVKVSALDKAQTDKTELRITFSDGSAQRLVWQVYLTGAPPDAPDGQAVPVHFVIEVDAMTGAVAILAQG